MSARIGVLLAAGMMCTGLVGGGTAAAAPAPGVEYVALGDSAAAGPLLPEQDMAQPTCARSSNNYPAVIARTIGARLTDASCSGARFADLKASPVYAASVPPQLDSLRSSTRLVTITMGANDVGMFELAMSCASLPGVPSAPCRTPASEAQLLGKIGVATARWAQAITAIKARAPHARIVAVGYGTYMRPGACPDRQPMKPADGDYLQSALGRLNDSMAAVARNRGVDFIDIRKMSMGHDVCASPNQAYYAGIVPASIEVPLHPTLLGMRAIGGYVARQIG